ncbi:MAG: D-glycero-beta-D-manno-heptose 1,7-bisphosphate 7-phosphatase [Arenicellales bacterium]
MDRQRLIILDRDGVINQDSDDFIKSPGEWQPIPGSLEAISRLCQAEYKVVVISNQSGISRGLLTFNTLNRIHQKMLKQLHGLGGEINAIFFCPHGPDDGCQCRKPAPGLFNELQQRLQCSLSGVDAVGDSLRDLQAARTASANPVLVRSGKGARTEIQLRQESVTAEFGGVPVFDDLAAYVESLRSRGLLEVVS